MSQFSAEMTSLRILRHTAIDENTSRRALRCDSKIIRFRLRTPCLFRVQLGLWVGPYIIGWLFRQWFQWQRRGPGERRVGRGWAPRHAPSHGVYGRGGGAEKVVSLP